MKITLPLLLSAALCAPSAFAAGDSVLLQADRDFARATLERGADGFLSFFADDAAILPKNGPPLTGREALSKAFHDTWAQPGYSLQWLPMKAQLARSGDLGYTYGSYERRRVVEGKPVIETGKYVTVWRRRRDGTWKVILDMGN